MLRAPLLGRSGIASAAASRAALRCRCSASNNGDGATPVQRGSLRPGTAAYVRATRFCVRKRKLGTAGMQDTKVDEKYTCAHVQRARPGAATAALLMCLQACKTPQLVSPPAHRHQEPGARHQRHHRVGRRGRQPHGRARALHAERRRGAALARRRAAGLRLLSGRPAVRPRPCPAAAPVRSRSV